MTPNPLATIMLLVWPLFVALIFTRMERVNAAPTPMTWLLNGTILGHAARLQYARALRRRWLREDSQSEAKDGMRPAR